MRAGIYSHTHATHATRRSAQPWLTVVPPGAAHAGPDLVIPVLGGIVEMVKDPYGFWEKQRCMSFPGLSWHSIVGVFTVFVTDAAISRHVFNHNSKVRGGAEGQAQLLCPRACERPLQGAAPTDRHCPSTHACGHHRTPC